MEIKKLIAILSLLLFSIGSYLYKTEKMQQHLAKATQVEDQNGRP